ncbi:Murinoglobulin-1 [Holothuria leucospilota]|uniref:Murinoglobulin-1 n=1 Tax=Holothuria leucospilota TaxID=206669 RepID=A0A9Q1BM83_HOLLE|nr:Murinoglobulin-1 [Holothuria leucospilota]
MKMFLTSLFIVVAGKCCLAAHHEPVEGMTGGNGGFGYFLLFPGNLEAGETVEGYIEANVTEPFTATLDFIHSYHQDRHFSSRQLITGGSGHISITVPEVDYWYGSVNFTAELEGTKEQYHGSESGVYIWRQKQQATFIETDKPIYKPGQEVKFRIVTINSHFRPDVSNISKIFVESPNNIRLVQWNDVERPDGLVDLAFQLIAEPTLGKYNVRAYIDGEWRSQSFKVEEYVLPKFEITFSAPKFILINAEEYAFQVCAKYTYGQPVRGSVSGQVGLRQREYSYYPRDRIDLLNPEGEQDEAPLMNPLDFAGELDQNGCLDVDLDITRMRLNSTEVPYWRSKLMIRATAYEANTGNEFSETSEVTELETTPMRFELKSPASFKPGIPYQGRIQVMYPDESPAAGKEIKIEATVDRESVFEQEFTADEYGVVTFEIPYAVNNQSVQLVVTSSDYKRVNHTTGYYQVYDPISYFHLNPGYSPTGRYIQIQPIYDTLSAGETPEIRVLYTSDDSSVSSHFKFQFVARNKLYDASAIAAGQDRMKRNSEPEEPIELPPGELGPPDTFITCPEGFEFGDGVKKCVRISDPAEHEESECERQAREADEKGGIGNFKPDCEENGDFAAQQCHSSLGQCWCVDENGRERTNTRRGPTEDRVDCTGMSPVEDEESECERQVREEQAKGLLGNYIPTCEENGDFAAQQCHGSSGNCWCVDENGQEIEGTLRGPTEEMVDCAEDIIEVEESDCETKRREAEEKGGIGSYTPTCKETGEYTLEQCHVSSGTCWCVDEEGNELPDTRRGPTEEKVDCESFFEETVVTTPSEELIIEPFHFTPPPPIIHYDPQELQEAVFSVKITASLSPVARLVVYYISPEGEVVADSVELKVNEAFENEVSLDFSDEEVLPGSETKLKVSAEPGSLCGVGIVDKSVYVLGGDNKLTPKKLFSEFDLSIRQVYSYRGCRGFYGRKKRDILFPGYRYPSVNYEDSEDALHTAGLLVMTNYDVSVAPCYYNPIGLKRFLLDLLVLGVVLIRIVRNRSAAISHPPGCGHCSVSAYSSDVNEGVETVSQRGGEQSAEDGEAKIRSYFPSTWLWTLQRVSENSAEMDLPVPHTITDWVANGFCTNVERGVGVAQTVTLRAFQPFFLSMSLPYSIIRTEKTPIKVSVFNYLKECLVVQVTLAESDDFELSGNAVFVVAVPAGESTVVSYKVTATEFGEIPLQVSAESVDDESGLCGSDPVGAAGARDAVLRNLLVKPEGEPETISQSAYFCLKEGDEPYSKQIFVDVPQNHVPGTAKGEVTVTGDLVGNTLSNVEDLIRMPYGCGEQNLVSMVPNIVALQYLQSVGESSSEIEEQAKRYILSGYQRELNYRRDDNSYSAFGNSNPEGSTFLTAFVVRTYAHADKFVDIDERDMNVTIDWLRSIQERDGSFRTVGYLAHKAMKGGVNNNLTLAAYVVSTFLEAGYTLQDPTVLSAFRYINSQLDSLRDTYSAALLAYAYALADMNEFYNVYEMLEDMAVEEEGTIHWETNREGLPSYTSYYQNSAKAQNIEMTAYVLRAIMIKDIPDALLIGSKIARWLVAQRNPRGGFSSTQDTVIGMTALAEFAMHGSGDDTEIAVTMDFSGAEQLEFDVNNDNRFIVQKDSFENFPADVSISASGKGCILYSVSGDYYIKKEKQTLDPFTLLVNAVPAIQTNRKRRQTTEGSDACDVFTVSIQARYNGEDGASNMAIINFRPVSGFVFDKDSLDSLVNKYTVLKRYEINADTITFYFDEITNEDIGFEFDVTKEFDVEDPKPAFITILDYYENGLKVAEEFEFVCGHAPQQVVVESTTYTTPVSPSGFQSSTPTETPDFDECSVSDICGGPEYECINYPGTYECVCAEGYTLDEAEVNCIAVPSCPVCVSSDLPDNAEEVICSADLIHVMKFLLDNSFRPLFDLVAAESIAGRYYLDVEIDEACTCDLLIVGDRQVVIATQGQISPSDGRGDEKILLDETVIIGPSVSSFKKKVRKILQNC